MKIIKTIIAMLLVLSNTLLMVTAEETKNVSYKATVNFDTGDVSVEETEITGPKDFSNLQVRVTMPSEDGTSIEIFEGLLKDYDGGKWVNIDFSEIDIMTLLNWETGEVRYIYPQFSNSTSILSTESVTDNISENTSQAMPISNDLSIVSQIKINGVNVGENGVRIIDDANMLCTFNVSNSALTSKTAKIFLATYTETGKLHTVRSFGVEVDAETTENVEVVYQFDAANEYTGKIFFWDSLSTIMPLRASIDFSQDSGINAYYYNADNRLLQIDKMNGTSLIFTYDNMGNLLTRTIRE